MSEEEDEATKHIVKYFKVREYHNGPILDMALAARKPILVTVSKETVLNKNPVIVSDNESNGGRSRGSSQGTTSQGSDGSKIGGFGNNTKLLPGEAFLHNNNNNNHPEVWRSNVSLTQAVRPSKP